MEKEEKERTDENSDIQYKGYVVDLIHEIAEVLGFKYTIKLVEDGSYGRKNERGEWNGMIKELIEGVIHVFWALVVNLYSQSTHTLPTN